MVEILCKSRKGKAEVRGYWRVSPRSDKCVVCSVCGVKRLGVRVDKALIQSRAEWQQSNPTSVWTGAIYLRSNACVCVFLCRGLVLM